MMRAVTLPTWFGDARVQRVLLLLLTVATYLGATQAAFVWDDRPLVVENQWIVGGAPLLEAFAVDLWETANVNASDQSSGYYRPLFLWSLAVDHTLHGLSEFGAHTQNLLWHLGAVLALYALLMRFFSPLGALAGALLFAIHPVQSEAVVWVSARSDLMAAALGLTALFILTNPKQTARGLGLAALLAFGALLSKESAVLLPFLLLLLDYGAEQRPDRRRYLALAVPLGLYLVLRLGVGVTSPAGPSGAAWGALFGALPAVVGVYSELLVWPSTLSVARDLESMGGLGAAGALAVLAVGLIFCLSAVATTRRRFVGVGLGFALLTFLPCLAAIADKGLLGERYLYLPLAGLGVVIASAFRRNMMWAAAGVLFAGFSVQRTGERLLDWRDEQTLWVAALEVSPSTFSEMSYGHALRAAEFNLAAHQRFRYALERDPPRLGACENVIGSALAANRVDLAITGALMAEQRGCDTPAFHAYFAVCRAFAGQWSRAAARAELGAGDARGRSGLVLAAAQIVAGVPEGYKSLESFTAVREDAKEQVANMLRNGGHPELADRVLKPEVSL